MRIHSALPFRSFRSGATAYPLAESMRRAMPKKAKTACISAENVRCVVHFHLKAAVVNVRIDVIRKKFFVIIDIFIERVYNTLC